MKFKNQPEKMFAFDLDGTITLDETLPMLAKELGLSEEMELLTRLTMEGAIAFDQSFKLRYHILKSISVKRIRDIMENVRLDPFISRFIIDNPASCVIITGNLDIWVQPIVEKLGCACYSSHSVVKTNGIPELVSVLDKGEAIRSLRKKTNKVIAIGESFNDVPMFEEATVSIAYGGVHCPVDAAISISDYVVLEGATLCRLLKML